MNPGCLCARTGQFSVDNKNCPLALLQPLRVVHEFKHLSDVHGRPSFAKRMIDAGERQVCSRTFGLSMQPWLLALMESAGWLLNRLHALSRCCVRQGFANHSLDLFRHHQLSA